MTDLVLATPPSPTAPVASVGAPVARDGATQPGADPIFAVLLALLLPQTPPPVAPEAISSTPQPAGDGTGPKSDAESAPLSNSVSVVSDGLPLGTDASPGAAPTPTCPIGTPGLPVSESAGKISAQKPITTADATDDTTRSTTSCPVEPTVDDDRVGRIDSENQGRADPPRAVVVTPAREPSLTAAEVTLGATPSERNGVRSRPEAALSEGTKTTTGSTPPDHARQTDSVGPRPITRVADLDPATPKATFGTSVSDLAHENPTTRTDDRPRADMPIVLGTLNVPTGEPIASAKAAPTQYSQPSPAPHLQLASVVGALRHEADGTYRITLHLHPADLGPVHVEVELHGSEIALRVVAENDSGRQALQSSVSELRSELEATGLTATSVDISGHGWQHGLDPRPDAPASPLATRPDEAPDDDLLPRSPAIVSPTRHDSALDLRL